MALSSLSECWESDATLRNRGRQHDRITQWPTVKSIGLASMKAANMNCRALELMANWWVACAEKPSTIPIDPLRVEAWDD